jgi:ADP-ribosylglycohydrolase
MEFVDRAYGMIISHAIGDALGAILEFSSEKFSPLANRKIAYRSLFQKLLIYNFNKK